MPSPIKELPKKRYETLEKMDRLRSMSLGLPIPKISRDVPWGYDKELNSVYTKQVNT